AAKIHSVYPGPSKTTTWNEFSSTMASAIIYLATNQKFNFSKYIFESMVKNLDNMGKFFMYPRFVQVFLEKQLEGMQSHKRIYDAPSHTKNIFRNMKRAGKGFSRRETPLFPAMKQRSRRPKRKDTELPQPSGPITNVADEAVNEEMDDSLERAATTATRLDAEQDRGNINKTQSKATSNEPSFVGTSSGGGPRHQETIGDTIAQTRFENVSKLSNDPLLARGNTLRSGKDSLKLKELMKLCTNLQNRVIDLEKTKTSQAQEITCLKRRVKRLEKKEGSRTHRLKRLYKVSLSRRVESSDEEGLGEEDVSKQGRIDDIDANEDIYLVNVHRDEDMFGVNDLEGDEVIVENEVDHEVVVKTEVASKDLQLLAQDPRLKVKGVVIGEQSESTTRTRPQQLPSKDKGKGIMEEPEKPTKKKDQIRHDEEVAQRLQAQMQAELEEEDRLVRQREEEANIVSWDNVQAMIDADYQMAQQMQAEEQEKLSIEEKSKLFVQLLEARKKHFAAIRAKEKRNKPPTKAQKRNTMSTYLKNMAGYKHNQLKNKSFDDIQKLFDKAMKRVNTFVDMDTELVEEEDKESEELKQCLEIVPDDGDDVTIDATPLSTKSPTIVDYKIHKEGKKSFFQIIRADARFKKTEPVHYMDNFLLLNLKTMFEHHVEDSSLLYYLLVEKMYPLTNHTLHQMFNDVKLQVDYECKMAFELLRLVKKQLKEGYVPE
ncbi:hypothetical protein Tco_0902457, partial [Tanacetum coccineum]